MILSEIKPAVGIGFFQFSDFQKYILTNNLEEAYDYIRGKLVVLIGHKEIDYDDAAILCHLAVAQMPHNAPTPQGLLDAVAKRLEENPTPPTTHPEMLEGETFMMNLTEVEFDHWQSDLPAELESVRLGNVAYTTSGERVAEELKYRPMFGRKRNAS